MTNKGPEPLPRKKKMLKKANDIELENFPFANKSDHDISEELQKDFLNSTKKDDVIKKKKLEKLKRSDAINKDHDEHLIQDNTFDPEKKKIKKKNINTEFGYENEAYIIEGTERVKNKKKKSEIFVDENNTKENEKKIIDDESTEEVLKKKKKKKSRKIISVEESKDEEVYDDYINLTELIIHRTDRLIPDYRLRHPFVRIHIVNEETGQYLKSSKLEVSQEKILNDDTDYLEPIYTNPFDFKKNKSTLPIFEERILVKEYFNFITNKKFQVIFLFEIIDFMDFPDDLNINISTIDESKLFKITWAFLRLRNPQGVLYTGQKIRLQLYKPINNLNYIKDEIKVYKWWKSKQFNKYPSTLYVTIQSITPKDVDFYYNIAFKPKKPKKHAVKDILQKEAEKELEWSRLPGQTCKIPNTLILSLKTSRKGCHLLAFSNNGRILASACQIEGEYHILLFEIPSGQIIGSLIGHLKLIYELDWSKNDEMLLTASADGSARVWNTIGMQQSKISTHPKYVYTAKFHPIEQHIFVTGSYDKILRIWSIDTNDIKCQIITILEYHCGFINSLVFSLNGSIIYSGDNLGIICIWNIDVKCSTYAFSKNIKLDELKGVTINSLALHPNNRNLLIHTRNNKISLLDLRTESIIRKYLGALNIRELIRSSYTPCGTYIFAGSEDGLVYVWASETGEQMGVFSQLGFRTTVTGLAYHPLDHIVAFSCLGESQPIKIYKFLLEKDDSNSRASNVRIPFDSNDLYQDKFRTMMSVMSLAGDEKFLTIQEKLEEITRSGFVKQPSIKDKKPNLNSNFGGSKDYEIVMTARDETKPIISFKDERKNDENIILKVLYAHMARRSDELHLHRGDKLKLLYKDSENWWVAEAQDGSQGFIPSSHVKVFNENDERLNKSFNNALPPQNPVPKKRRSSHALITRTGQLEIITNDTTDADSDVNN